MNNDSGVRVTCDVGYFCANFSLPRPLCSRLRPDVCDRRQTSDAHHRLMSRKHMMSVVGCVKAAFSPPRQGGYCLDSLCRFMPFDLRVVVVVVAVVKVMFDNS